MERRHHGGGGKGDTKMGVIHVVGTGPGDVDFIPAQAIRCLEASEVIIGYATYLDLIAPYLDGKEVVSSAMMQEVERCTRAFELAESGKTVSLVSGGDPGIYAMAGLVYEIAIARDSEVEINVVPGIAALNASAACLGAPLMHDFAAISLSDLLTPWPVIERRLEAAFEADFVVVLYNPQSKKRRDQIRKAHEIALRYRLPETPAGIVTAAKRATEKVVVTSLAALLDEEITMQSTVIIGNSTTFVWRNKMITPRGYTGKYQL